MIGASIVCQVTNYCCRILWSGCHLLLRSSSLVISRHRQYLSDCASASLVRLVSMLNSVCIFAAVSTNTVPLSLQCLPFLQHFDCKQSDSSVLTYLNVV